MKSILAIMEELAAAGASAEEMLQIFYMAQDRVVAKSKVTKERDKVLSSLRDYLMCLCGDVDEGVMKEFEQGLINLEKIYKQVTVQKITSVDDLDKIVDDIIRKSKKPRGQQ